jgi:hypothetical protein
MKKSQGDAYFNVTGYPFPLGPLTRRKTIRREVKESSMKLFCLVIIHQGLADILCVSLFNLQIRRDVMWVFEQPQSLGFSNVTTNVRMTVIKLASGGLWVHAPIAPTPECLALLRELGSPVEYIVLPTFAYEHKIFVGPFSRKFPKAKVYVAPK